MENEYSTPKKWYWKKTSTKIKSNSFLSVIQSGGVWLVDKWTNILFGWDFIYLSDFLVIYYFKNIRLLDRYASFTQKYPAPTTLCRLLSLSHDVWHDRGLHWRSYPLPRRLNGTPRDGVLLSARLQMLWYVHRRSSHELHPEESFLPFQPRLHGLFRPRNTHHLHTVHIIKKPILPRNLDILWIHLLYDSRCADKFLRDYFVWVKDGVILASNYLGAVFCGRNNRSRSSVPLWKKRVSSYWRICRNNFLLLLLSKIALNFKTIREDHRQFQKRRRGETPQGE